MKKLTYVTGAVLLLGATSALALTPGRTIESQITQVFGVNTGGGNISLASDKLQDGTTVCSANKRYSIDANEAGANGLLAVALTASASDTNVQLDVIDCDVNPVVIQNIILK